MRAANRLFSLAAASVMLVAFTAGRAAPHFDAPDPQALSALIDEAVGTEAPGVAVGVVQGDAVVFSHQSGLANLELSAPIGARSRFNIASNAKQFTALMVLELAHQGQIDLTADFRTYLPGALPGVDARITVDHLLGHTSGVRDIYDLWALTGVTWYERALTNTDAMALLNRQTALNFEPGSQFLYSNSNYILLAELIEAVTGQDFHEHARSFFDARGMTSTSVRRRYGVVLPDMARAYGNWDGWLEDPALANLHGDGFLYSTLDDQLLWETQVWGGASTLPAAVIAQSQQRPDGSPDATYGYGLEFGAYRGLPISFHVGSTGGYNAYALRFPTLQTSIVVLGNTTEVGVVQLGRQIADLVLADALGGPDSYPDGPDSVDPDHAPSSAVGAYEFESGTFVRIVERDGDLYREIEGRDPVRLIPERANLYHYESNPGLRVAFDTAPGRPRSFELFAAFQGPQSAFEIAAPPVGQAYRQSLEGVFVNAETGAQIELHHLDGDRFELVAPRGTSETTLAGEDYLAWNSYRIRVDRTGDAADRLLLSGGRLRGVVFSRTD